MQSLLVEREREMLDLISPHLIPDVELKLLKIHKYESSQIGNVHNFKISKAEK